MYESSFKIEEDSEYRYNKQEIDYITDYNLT
jgi:hypothetical protein